MKKSTKKKKAVSLYIIRLLACMYCSALISMAWSQISGFTVLNEYKLERPANNSNLLLLNLCTPANRLYFYFDRFIDLNTGEISEDPESHFPIARALSSDCTRILNFRPTGFGGGAEFHVEVLATGESPTGIQTTCNPGNIGAGAFHPQDADVFFLGGSTCRGDPPGIFQRRIVGEGATIVEKIIDLPQGTSPKWGMAVDPEALDFFLLASVCVGEAPCAEFQPQLICLTSEGKILDRIALEQFGIAEPSSLAFNPNDGHLFIGDGSFADDNARIVELAPTANAGEGWERYE